MVGGFGIPQRAAVGYRLRAPVGIVNRASGYTVFVGTGFQFADISGGAGCFRAFVFAAGFANSIFRYRAAFAGLCTDLTAAFAGQETGAGIVFAFVFGRAAAVAAAVGNIPVSGCLSLRVGIAVAGIAFAFVIRAVIRADLRTVFNISVIAACVITCFFACARRIVLAGSIIVGIIRTLAGWILRSGTGSYCISFILALFNSIYSKIFITLAKRAITAFAEPEETDGGGFIGKGRRCRFQDRCVCMCVFKYSVIVWGQQSQIHGRYRRDKS